MAPIAAPIAANDWRDAAAYARLLPGGRHCFAWEWLRRSPAYIAAWEADNTEPSAFGLLRFEDPARDALAARPFWHCDIDPAVLCAERLSHRSHDRLDLRRLAPFAVVIPGDPAGVMAEYILLSDGPHAIRVDLLSGSLAAGPAPLRWRIDGVAGAGPRLLALRQLVALARSGCFARSLHPPERRARRWIAMLRVHDALAAGATHREIVGVLFGIDVGAARWRMSAGPWRLRVQRLAAGARRALAAGPAAWFGEGGLDA